MQLESVPGHIRRSLLRAELTRLNQNHNSSSYTHRALSHSYVVVLSQLATRHSTLCPDRYGFDRIEGENVDRDLARLTEKLKQQEKQLHNFRQNFSERLQTSFLRRDILDVGFLNCIEVNSVLETISEIARHRNWFNDEKTKKLIYDVLYDLQSMDVSGDPEVNMFCMSPVVFFLNIVAWVVYYPVLITLMVLLMLGRVQGWIPLITGFARATISAISMQNDALSTASQILGIITGILAAAKGITLEQDGKSDYLYARVEDLTVEIIHRSFGNISKVAVFQPFWDQSWCPGGNAFNKFAMTLRVKKADIRKVQDVRMFFAVVVCTSLVQNAPNFSYIDKLMMISKRVEGVLIDPYNYLTFQELEEDNFEGNKYGFKNLHAKEIKEIYNKVTPVNSVCSFLRELNEGNVLLPLVQAQALGRRITDAFSFL